MKDTELKGIRERLGLSQSEFAEPLKTSRVSVTRMENGTQVITLSMALLIGYVAREGGVEVADGQRSRRAAPAKKRAQRGKARHTVRSQTTTCR